MALGQTLIVYGIARAFGGRFRGSLPLGILIVSLSVLSFVGIGFLFGARLAGRTEDVNGPVSAIGVPLLVLGGTFFPVSILPPSLLAVAWLNPIFHMNEALKGVWARGLRASEIAPHLSILAVLSVGALLLGARSYRELLTSEGQA